MNNLRKGLVLLGIYVFHLLTLKLYKGFNEDLLVDLLRIKNISQNVPVSYAFGIYITPRSGRVRHGHNHLILRGTGGNPRLAFRKRYLLPSPTAKGRLNVKSS